MKQEVGIFIGRFQPFTNKHIEIINRMSVENDDCYVIIVRGKKTSKDIDKNPFSRKEQENLIDMLNFPVNVHFYFTENAYFFNLFDSNYYNFKLYVGTDRIDSYKKSFKDKISKYIEIKRNDEDISATKIRDLIRKRKYNKLMEHYNNEELCEYFMMNTFTVYGNEVSDKEEWEY